MNDKFYITTTLPYVNAEPHIGFALEIVQADVIARWQKSFNKTVVFNFGTDEHGQKIYQKALEQGRDPKEYCDEYAAKFDDLKKALNLSYTNFIRTTDEHHVEAAKEFWIRCQNKGDIYKKVYKTKYCVGCELEKTDSELVDGRCPVHPNRDLEVREEENYFFRFSKYQEPLLQLYSDNPEFVIPEGKLNEIKTFTKSGLEDFSVSRLKAKMPWGIEVPGDPEHVMYVWFDALINYISTLGWPEDEKQFTDFWPGLQVAGKDNLRQQSAMWQAMLLSAGLPTSKQIFIHGFMTLNGQKISKSLGNTINPIELTEKYGTDAVRYYLLSKIHPWEDSDFTYTKFEDSYNADLANGLGNLTARLARLRVIVGADLSAAKETTDKPSELEQAVNKKLELFRFDEALFEIWRSISDLDRSIEQEKPWEYPKADDDRKTQLKSFVNQALLKLRQIAGLLAPFIPETSEKIQIQLTGDQTSPSAILFPRLIPNK